MKISPRSQQNNQYKRIAKEIQDMKEKKKKLETQILEMESIRLKKMNENLRDFSVQIDKPEIEPVKKKKNMSKIVGKMATKMKSMDMKKDSD